MYQNTTHYKEKLVIPFKPDRINLNYRVLKNLSKMYKAEIVITGMCILNLSMAIPASIPSVQNFSIPILELHHEMIGHVNTYV